MTTYLFFDTETTGLPKAPTSDFRNWPRLVQLAWLLMDENQNIKSKYNYIIKPNGYHIPQRVIDIHGITMHQAVEEGIPVEQALHRFLMDSNFADVLVAHNIAFDYGVLRGELLRKRIPDFLEKRTKFCTMSAKQVLDFCKNFRMNNRRHCPSLSELYYLLFDAHLEHAHNALIDAEACANCFFELKKLGMVQ